MSTSSEQTPNVQELFKATIELEKELRTVLRQKNSFHDEAVILRSRIKTLYEQIVFLDYEYATSKEVEINLWKIVFYKVIEDYRRKLRQISGERTKSSELKRVKNSFRSFLQEAAGFYVSFKQRLATNFQLCLPQNFLNKALLYDTQPERFGSKALSSYQQCLIYLGDLARYREMYTDRHQKNWSAAIECYSEALTLVPTNGNPHNQLAVVSSYHGDELSTIYHYYRSLVTSQPFLTAKENIDLLFQRSKKLFDSSPKSNEDFDGAFSSTERSRDLPKKIGVINQGAVKEFIREYIYLHGILHMRTDLNSFPVLKDSVISKYKELLDSRSLDADQILQITLINIAALFVFRHYKTSLEAKEKNTSATLQASRNGVLERHLYLLIIEMFQVMMEVGSNVFEVIATKKAEKESSRDRPEFPACVKRILPSARVTLQWVLKNLNLYQISSTQVRRTAVEQETIHSFWKSFVSFMNCLYLKFGRITTIQIHPMKEDFEIQGFIAIKPEVDISLTSLVRSKMDSQSETRLRALSLIRDARTLVELQLVPLKFDPQLSKPFSYDENKEPTGISHNTTSLKTSDPMAAAIASVPDLIKNITSSMYSSSASPGFGYGFKDPQNLSSDEEIEGAPFSGRPRHSKNSIVVGSGRAGRSSNSTPYNQSPELNHEAFDARIDAPVGVKALNNEESGTTNGATFNLWNQYGPNSVYESRRSSYNNSPSAVGAPLPSIGNNFAGTNSTALNSIHSNEQFGYSAFPQSTCSEQYRRETPSGLGILTGMQAKSFSLGGSPTYDKPDDSSSSLFSGSAIPPRGGHMSSFSSLGQNKYTELKSNNYESSNSLFSESMGMSPFNATAGSPNEGQFGTTTRSPICPPPGFGMLDLNAHRTDRQRSIGNHYSPYTSPSLDSQNHGILHNGVATDQYR